jgi:hypothetical protein
MPAPPAAATPALVVFADDTTLKWLRPLKSGFRHCFVLVKRDGAWILCNPLSHYTDLDAVGGSLGGPAMADWYRRQGFTVVETLAVRPPPVCAPVRPFTCVEAVKRALGLQAPWVFTPAQLYRHLTGDPAVPPPTGIGIDNIPIIG